MADTSKTYESLSAALDAAAARGVKALKEIGATFAARAGFLPEQITPHDLHVVAMGHERGRLHATPEEVDALFDALGMHGYTVQRTAAFTV